MQLRNTRKSASILFALALTLLKSNARAQEKPEGWYLTSPLAVSSGFDQGFIAKSGVFNDTVTLLAAPTFSLMKTTRRRELFIDYRPEFEIFAHNSDLNAWNHLSAVRFKYQINARWSFDAGNLFMSTSDASRQMVNSLLLLPRGRFLQNAPYMGWGYRMNSRTRITFRADNAYTHTDLPGALAGRLDGLTTAGTVTLDRKYMNHQKLSLSYAYLHSHPLQSYAGGSDSNVQLFNAGYTIELDPGLNIALAAGAVKSAQSSFIGTAFLEKKLGNIWVAGGYQRYLSFFGGLPTPAAVVPGTVGVTDGLTPGSVYQVVSFRTWGQFKHFTYAGSVQKVLNGRDTHLQSISGVIAQTQVNYKFTDRFSWFVRLEHYGQNGNLFLGTPLSRSRYFTGFEMTLSRPPMLEKPKDRRGLVLKDPEPAKDPDAPVDPAAGEKNP